MRPSYSWVVPIAISWSTLALGVTFVRFGKLPGDGAQIAAGMLGFLLMGVLSGFVLILLLRRITNRSGRISSVVGYALATPLGYIFGIVGPLALEAFSVARLPNSIDFILLPLAIGFYGSLPLICGVLCGAAVGLFIGRITGRSP